jgi:hypothetical protein
VAVHGLAFTFLANPTFGQTSPGFFFQTKFLPIYFGPKF